MKTSNLVFLLFVLLAVLYTLGSFFEIPEMFMLANVTLVPVLLVYYQKKAQEIFWPIVVILVCFYLRDIFMMLGFDNYPLVVMYLFVVAMVFWYTCAITGFQWSRLHTAEIISLVIMFGFLAFLAVTMGEMVDEAIPDYSFSTYLYLILLTLLLGITFTSYLLKSHWASLWLMVASASLLVSELSLFFKMFILEDISVNFFAPAFHVFMFYALTSYGIHRRKTGFLRIF